MNGNRYLLLRRAMQSGVLGLFLLGPLAGIWLVKGNLNYSLTLSALPLTDLFVGMQTLTAGHIPEQLGLIGLVIVVAAYLTVGGRSYCAWVCPMNPVTDLAHWLRRRFGIKGGAHLPRNTRYWFLGMALAVSAMTGGLAWELVNPISMLHRGLIYGMGMAWTIVLAIFLFDLFVMDRGWCGHLCPTGAAYSLLGHGALLRVRADRRAACDDCMDCFEVCPEPRIIRPALKGGPAHTSVILSEHCTNCGRCIDVCAKDVFRFGSRLSTTQSFTPSPEERQS